MKMVRALVVLSVVLSIGIGSATAQVSIPGPTSGSWEVLVADYAEPESNAN